MNENQAAIVHQNTAECLKNLRVQLRMATQLREAVERFDDRTAFALRSGDAGEAYDRDMEEITGIYKSLACESSIARNWLDIHHNIVKHRIARHKPAKGDQ